MSKVDYKFSEGYAANDLLHTPEGVRDIYNEECAKKLMIQNEIHHILHLYGYRDIQTPSFEFFDIFNKERGTTPSKEMYKFFDRDNNTLVLRPDITPSIARATAKYYKDEVMPIRFCYVGNTYTNTSKYQGKLKEITQVGAELINENSVDADAEMIALCIESLLKVGLSDFQVEIGHADFLNGMIEEADFDEDEIMQLKSCLENKNLFGVEELVEEKKIKSDLKELLLKLPELFGDYENLRYAKERVHNKKSLDALERMSKVTNILKQYGYESYVSFDLGMLSHYNYYTGIILKAYTYGTGNVIVTGGRYDNLVAQFGKHAPAIGVAFVIDQLMLALERQNIKVPMKELTALIVYEDVNRETAITLANRMRQKNACVELMKMSGNSEEYLEYGKRVNSATVLFVQDENQGILHELHAGTSKEVDFSSLARE